MKTRVKCSSSAFSRVLIYSVSLLIAAATVAVPVVRARPSPLDLRSALGLSLVRKPEGGAVDPKALRELINSGDSLTVTDGPDDAIIYSTSNTADLRSLSESLDIEVPEDWSHDMCDGSPAIHILRAGKELVRISYHHGYAIRTSLWSSDAPLKDNGPLLSWFDAHGINGPRSELESARIRARESEQQQARWLAAMPPALHPFRTELMAIGPPGT
jgi:hypothetical protein